MARFNSFYKAIAAYSVLTVLFISFILIGALGVNRLRYLHTQEEKAYRILYSTSKLSKCISEMESSVRGYKLYNNSVYLAPYYEGRKIFSVEHNNLERLIADEEERTQLKEIQYNLLKWRKLVRKTIYNQKQFIAESPERTQITRGLKSRITKIQEIEASRVSDLIQQISVTETRIIMLYFLFSFASLSIAVYASKKSSKSVKNLSEVNKKLNLEAEDKTRIENELFLSLAVRSLIIDNFPQGVIIYDDKGLITQLNKEADRILDTPKASSLMGTHINTLFSGTDFSPHNIECSVPKKIRITSQSNKGESTSVTVTPYKVSIGYTVVYSLFIKESDTKGGKR